MRGQYVKMVKCLISETIVARPAYQKEHFMICQDMSMLQTMQSSFVSMIHAMMLVLSFINES